MLIALLDTKGTSRDRVLLGAFAEGAAKHGDRVRSVHETIEPPGRQRKSGSGLGPLTEQALRDVDLAVQAYYPKPHDVSSPLARVNRFLRRSGKRILTIETGFIRNQSEWEMALAAKGRPVGKIYNADELQSVYYALGYDGIKGDADYGVKLDPSQTKLNKRWRQLGLELKPWREDGEHVLIIGQTLGGVSTIDLTSVPDWYAKIIHEIRSCTKRPIVFRHHWRNRKIRTNKGRSGDRLQDDRKLVSKAIGKVADFSWSTNDLLLDDLRGAWAAVCYTSNAGVAAAIEGVPLIVTHPRCVAYPVAGHSYKNVVSPVRPERTPWANWLAYTQWNVAEIKSGEAWAHLRPIAT